MIDQHITDALGLRHAYRAVFGKKHGRISRFFKTRLVNAYERVFTKENDDAQRVIADLCKKADITRSCFTPGKPDLTAYDNGARDLVLGILRMVHSSDEEIRRQIEEIYKQNNQ